MGGSILETIMRLREENERKAETRRAEGEQRRRDELRSGRPISWQAKPQLRSVVARTSTTRMKGPAATKKKPPRARKSYCCSLGP
jgi:hypothetical protein